MGPFFRELGGLLAARGHRVLRINLNGGDRFFWHDERSVDYKGRFCEWAAFIRNIGSTHAITDLVIYGDCRPMHRTAMQELKALGAVVHVFEEGYVRPHWVTLEKGGVNAYSDLPRHADFYLQAPLLPEPPFERSGKAMLPMGCYASLYTLAQLFRSWRFRHYRHHLPLTPAAQVRTWVPRLLTLPCRRLHARALRHRLRDRRFFLVPLQLNRDMQIIHHSPYSDCQEFCSQVIESFARHARKDCLLLFKNHPLDNGARRISRHIRRHARAWGISRRVRCMDAGKLPFLLTRALGVVTVNSTSGISAIHHACPTIALGKAVYNFRGLTFQGPLDDFWASGERPSPELYLRFRAYLLHHKLLGGNFYNRKGRALLLEKAARGVLLRAEAS